MRTVNRHATVVLLGLALVASACSGGGEEAATTPITAAPAAELPDAVGDALFDMLFQKPPTTSTTTPEERVVAEAFVSDLTKTYFQAAAAGQWDAVYDASAVEFKDTCTPEEFSTVTSTAVEPVELTFGTTDIQVVGDFATGSFEVSDDEGSLRVEGLLAYWEPDGWRMALDPCDVAGRVASGDFSYPVVLTTTTAVAEISPDADGAADTPSLEAPIDPAITLPEPDASTTTTVPDILGPPPIGGTTTTTTTLPPIPLSAAEEIEIEAVIQQFIVAEATQDYVSLHAAVPPLFACTPADASLALDPFPWSPTGVTFGPFEMIRGNVGHSDEAFATFDVTYLDSGETLTITDFGVWEWGGTWYAAVHPCKWVLNAGEAGTANEQAVGFMEEILLVARDLYAGAGDYDIPTSTLNAIFIDDALDFVGTPDQAGVGTFAYVDGGQEVHVVTQSASGRWYCFVDNAVTGAHFGSSFLPNTIDTPAGCRSVTLAVPWSLL